MTLQVKHVPLQYVAQTWPLVEPHLKAAEKYGTDYNIEQIKVFVGIGQWVLMVVVDENGNVRGGFTVSFLNYPNDRVAFITCIGGRLIANPDTFNQMKLILRELGATKIQGAARESVARLWRRLGFERKYIVVETKI